MRSGRLGALTVISLLFAAAGAVHVGAGLGLAMASAVDAGDTPPAAEKETSPVGTSCSDMPATLARALSEREGRVTAREAALEAQVTQLAEAREEIARELAALAEAENSLRQTIQVADGAAEADLARLTAVYEAMKPKEAAAVFTAMSPEFAAGFLGRMQPGSAAAVLASLPPEVAFEISARIAGRNARAPRE